MDSATTGKRDPRRDHLPRGFRHDRPGPAALSLEEGVVPRAGNGKLSVIGGWGGGKAQCANDEYDPATDKWESRKPMAVGRNHAFVAALNGKIYVISGRTGHGFIMKVTNMDVVEEFHSAIVATARGANWST